MVEGFRRRGIGVRLIEKLLSIARERDMVSTFVMTNIANERAMRLYQRTGARNFIATTFFWRGGTIEAARPGGKSAWIWG